jgi:hypothetical protein
MKRRRLTSVRLVRIVTWTAVATAWVSALLGRLAAPSAGTVPLPGQTRVEILGTVPAATIRDEPGLMVIHSVPSLSPGPQQPVVRRVVQTVVERPVVQSRGS